MTSRAKGRRGKVRAAARESAAARSGNGSAHEGTGTSVLDLLAQDHRALEQQLKELALTPSADAAERAERFARLQALLQAHARAEEEVVYRRLQKAAPDDILTLEAFEEHHVADVLLQELASSSPGGPGWTAKLRVLEELVQHHIKEEEVDLFALVRNHFDGEALTRMGIEFRVAKHEDLERFLAPLRRATPAFAGRATIYAQAAAGRMVRRGELALRRAMSRMPTA